MSPEERREVNLDKVSTPTLEEDERRLQAFMDNPDHEVHRMYPAGYISSYLHEVRRELSLRQGAE